MQVLWAKSQEQKLANCPPAPKSCVATPTEYNLPFDAVVKVRVRAGNGAGQGKWSDPNSDADSARVRNIP